MRKILLGALAVLVLAAVAYGVWNSSSRTTTSEPAQTERLVVNEAARTLLYLPLYHADRMGYFSEEALDVDVVTGGTATASVAAIMSGDADIAQADPMYAPISRASGSDVRVVGQIVGRVGLWALARPGAEGAFDRQGVLGESIITHPRPMSAYTYTELRLRALGVADEVRVIQAKPGTELATYAAETGADFLVGVEPTVSILEGQGARVVYSWASAEGDRVFSGLLVRQATLDRRPRVIASALRAYQRALDDIAQDKPSVLETARFYFPNLDEVVLRRALERLRTEQVFPRTLAITPDSWVSAVRARQAIGDISGDAPYGDNVASTFTASALRD